MAQWKEYATPGENHRVLDRMVGNWKHKVQYWMSQDGPTEQSEGTSVISWILGGKFLQHMVQGKSMGEAFEGMGLIGYDNIRKEYNTIWLDSMGTGMMKGSGSFNQESLEFSESGDFSCPLVNNTRPYRATTKLIDEDNFTYETYMTDEQGNEFRSMLITYTRQK